VHLKSYHCHAEFGRGIRRLISCFCSIATAVFVFTAAVPVWYYVTEVVEG